MIGIGECLAFCLLAFLVSTGVLVASRHGHSAWPGLGMGLAAWMALIAGYLVALMSADWLQRKKYPNRIGMGWQPATMVFIVLGASAFTSIILYRWITSS